MVSAGMSSGPAALPFFSGIIAFKILVLVGLVQLISRSVSGGGMSVALQGEDDLTIL